MGLMSITRIVKETTKEGLNIYSGTNVVSTLLNVMKVFTALIQNKLKHCLSSGA